jgi:DNA-directed RNA polymerase subunit RPC12/RpoP
MKEEKEYRCPECKKSIKESKLKIWLTKHYGNAAVCPYCSGHFLMGCHEVDWVSKIIGAQE